MLSRYRAVGKLAALMVLFLSFSGQARADSFFGSRNAFRAAIAGTSFNTEGWDEFASGTIIHNGALVNGVTYRLSDPTADFIITAGGATISSPNGLGRTNSPFGGEAFVPSDVITFTFSIPISAFGVSFNTASATGGAYTVTTNLGGIAPSGYDPFPGLSTGQFAGFISDGPISSVTIRTGVPFLFGLDDMIFARSVSEPSSLALLALGTCCFIGIRLAGYSRYGEHHGMRARLSI